MSADIPVELGTRIYRAAFTDRYAAFIAVFAIFVFVFELALHHHGPLWVDLVSAAVYPASFCIVLILFIPLLKSSEIYVSNGSIYVVGPIVNRTYSPGKIRNIVVGRPVHRTIIREGFRFRRLPEKECSISIRGGHIIRTSGPVIGSEDLIAEIIREMPDVEIIRRRYGKD